ncbi:MAG TPA: molecular chaperone DnaJ [Clostridiales bacterium]|nr:molecular chaperone DnaJ [Clostridiales bacterium]
MSKTPYEVLGVQPSASATEIKKAYRDLVKKYHPDNYKDHPLESLAKEKMQEINEAYDQLTDPNNRQSTQRPNTGPTSPDSQGGWQQSWQQQQQQQWQQQQNQRYGPYYRQGGMNGSDVCNTLGCLCCSDSCCECMGGDLCGCC